jgi:hypothetical protein
MHSALARLRRRAQHKRPPEFGIPLPGRLMLRPKRVWEGRRAVPLMRMLRRRAVRSCRPIASAIVISGSAKLPSRPP